MNVETNAVDPVKSWTPEQNATIDGLQQKLGWSRVQSIHKLRQGEKAGKTPTQILAEATASKTKPAAKAKPAAKPKAKRGQKAERTSGKYNKEMVVRLYMEEGKNPTEIHQMGQKESAPVGIKGISAVYAHRILFGNENSGGISIEQAARRKEQAARVKAWASEKAKDAK